MVRFSIVSAAAVAALMILSASPADAQDAEAGKKVFARCGACHNADKPQNKVGPHLVGLIGRQAGSVEGFKYSDANKNSGVVWSAETLNEYLADPKGYMPGNKMAFVGLKNEAERKNVIAYLEQATKTQ